MDGNMRKDLCKGITYNYEKTFTLSGIQTNGL